MATKQANSSRETGKRAQKDALQLLKSDHAEVKALFDQFEKLGEEGDALEKESLVREACANLTVHATLEEEIFYPAAREVPDVDALLNEAAVEHGGAKDLITKLEAMDSDDEMFDAHFTVLSEYIKHHVKEEEGELFPKVAKSDLDLDALGEAMQARKDELSEEETLA